MTDRKVLGRGIASLIPPPRVDREKEAAEGKLEIEIDAIRANPQQPRRRFSEAALDELAHSIRQVGVLQPLLVRKTDFGYQLIAGERRLRAAKRAGLAKVPVVVRQSNDQEELELALVENLQREDLNPIEEAKGYERLAEEFFLTQEEIAKRVGKERSTVTNLMRLLKLSLVVQEMVASGVLSMGHARAILGIAEVRRQEELARKVEAEKLSVRQVEQIVRKMVEPKGDRRKTDAGAADVNLRHVGEEFQRVLGTKVEIRAKGKGGEVRISYFNPSDLKRISERILDV